MKRPFFLTFILAVSSLFLLQAQEISPGAGGILHVKKGGAGNQSGDSWDNAVAELDEALQWVHNEWDGSGALQVWVAAGAYTPAANGFVMKNNVAIYGGFGGTESSLEDRDWTARETILSGDCGAGCRRRVITNWFPAPGNPPLTNTAILDGFIIQQGYDIFHGGGIYNENASPVLSNLIIRGNEAGQNGGGIFNTGSSNPILTNVTITGNKANQNGGGICNLGASTPVLVNVTIAGNRSVSPGGGIYTNRSSPGSPTLENTIVWGNIPEDVYNNNTNSAPVIHYSLIGAESCPPFASCANTLFSTSFSTFFDAPGFVSAPDAFTAPFTGGNYTLLPFSPGVNGGNPATNLALFPGGPDYPLDLAGGPRVFGRDDGGIIDIGAYEYQGASSPLAASHNALSFDRFIGNRVRIPDAGALDLTGSYTLECWIRPYGFNSLAGLISKYHSNNSNGYLLRLSGASPFTGLDFDGRSTGNGILRQDVWHHIAAVNQNGTRRLYVNGVEVQLVSGSAINVQPNTDDLMLGVDYYPASPRYFDGSMDEVRLWNVARSQAEIQAAMNAPVPADSPNLVAYYQFNTGLPGGNNEALPKVVTDVTGNGHDGEAIGFTMNGGLSNWVGSYAMVVPVAEEATDITTTGFTAGWSAPEGASVSYYMLDVSPDPAFGTFLDGYDGLNVGNVTEYEITGLPLPVTYYYRVRAVSIVFGIGAPSNTVPVATNVYSPDNNVLYVRKGGAGTQDGSSWDNAVPELAYALRWARGRREADGKGAGWDEANPLQVRVAAGTYKPLYHAGSYTADGGRNNAFVLVPHVHVYGGFDPAAGFDPDTRILPGPDTDPASFTGTILSGDTGTEGNPSDNVYHVVISAGEVGAAQLDGLVITGGNATGSALPVAVHEKNIVTASGGGLYIDGSSPELTNVAISGNQAAEDGGGVYVTGSSGPSLSGVTIRGNTANAGGGLHNGDGSHTQLVNSHIRGNVGTNGGGGIYSYGDGTALTLTNVTVSGNLTHSAGGGIFNAGKSQAKLINTLVSGNASLGGGGILSLGDGTTLRLTNVTISGNSSFLNGGGGITNATGSVAVLHNAIIWGNQSGQGGTATTMAKTSSLLNIGGATYEIQYSLVANFDPADFGGSPGNVGGVVDNPFEGAPSPPAAADAVFSGGNYHLVSGSPAVNAGSNARYTDAGGAVDDTDLAGHARIQNGIVDMGAFESPYVDIAPTDRVLYVREGGAGDRSGRSWDDATPELAEALRWARVRWGADGSAADWDEDNPLRIYVAAGVYKPLYKIADTDNLGNAATDRDRAFMLVPHVRIYGGFDPGAGFDPDARILPGPDTDPAAFTGTILSGDLNGDDSPEFPETNKSENTFHVLVSVGDIGAAALDGVAVTGGHSIGASGFLTVNGMSVGRSGGAGMYNTGSSPQVTNVIITGNAADGNGGGMFNANASHPSLANVAITGNKAVQGGGMFNNSLSNPQLTNVAITGNTAGSGGGIYNFNSSPVLKDATISGNNAENGSGGGMFNSISSFVLSNVTVSGNTANTGGGIYNVNGGNPVITNAAITGNTASTFGGAMLSNGGNPVLTNVTITKNTSLSATAGQTAGLHVITDAVLALHNSIVWDNTKPGGTPDNLYAPPGNTLDINHSLLQGNPDNWTWGTTQTGTDGGGNIITGISPFVDENGGDYRLAAASQAINKGNNTLYDDAGGDLVNDLDLAGNPRVQGVSIDIGAYEFHGSLPVVLANFKATHQENVILLTWQTAGEINASHFEIERSADAKAWETIGWVHAKGESNTSATYSFIDHTVRSAPTLPAGRPIAYYRLKILDRAADHHDHSFFTYSRIEAVYFEKTAGSAVLVYPNPVRSKVTIELRSGGTGHLQVCDLLGRVIRTQAIDGKTELDIRALPSGMYLVHIREGGQTEVRKLLVE